MAERPTVVDLVAAVVTSEATRLRLAEFGRYGWAFGLAGGVPLGICAERYAWPSWTAAAVGAVVFAAGVLVIGWAARRAAGRVEG